MKVLVLLLFIIVEQNLSRKVKLKRENNNNMTIPNGKNEGVNNINCFSFKLPDEKTLELQLFNRQINQEFIEKRYISEEELKFPFSYKIKINKLQDASGSFSIGVIDSNLERQLLSSKGSQNPNESNITNLTEGKTVIMIGNKDKKLTIQVDGIDYIKEKECKTPIKMYIKLFQIDDSVIVKVNHDDSVGTTGQAQNIQNIINIINYTR